MEKSKELAILILAAGNSSRLGEPKQLVTYKNSTLLEHACKKALQINENVFVVLGANFLECKKKIQNLDVSIIENRKYKDGLSSSIKEGILNITQYNKTLIMLCDQPFIDMKHLKKLIDQSKNSNNIVSSYYKNDVAVPAVFPKEFYSDLMELQGDKGAKSIIKKFTSDVIVLEDSLAIDIDTQEDKIYLD